MLHLFVQEYHKHKNLFIKDEVFFILQLLEIMKQFAG